jgi:predicted DNA binding CopG/RHH family protein
VCTSMRKLRSEENFELEKEYDFSKGVRGRFYKPHKVRVSLRINDDVLLFFKKLASEKRMGYQTLINSVLLEYSRKIIEKTKK